MLSFMGLSLLQLFSSAAVAVKQPQIICKQMSLTVPVKYYIQKQVWAFGQQFIAPDLEKYFQVSFLKISHQVTEYESKRDLRNHLGQPSFCRDKEIGVGSNSYSQLMSKLRTFLLLLLKHRFKGWISNPWSNICSYFLIY